MSSKVFPASLAASSKSRTVVFTSIVPGGRGMGNPGICPRTLKLTQSFHQSSGLFVVLSLHSSGSSGKI